MQRYFVEKIVDLNNIIINNDDYYHITKVMRMRVNDEVYLCDQENTYIGRIIDITSNEVILKVVLLLDEKKELPFNVTIAHGIIRKEKMEETIDNVSALGASFYIPVEMERCNAKFHEEKIEKKMIRLNKIAKEACEQSHRMRLLKVEKPIPFKELLKKSKDYDLLLVAYENSNINETLKKVLNPSFKNILVVVGPEGGISNDEISSLEKIGFIKVSLGPRILRTELAPVYIMSVIGYELGDIHEKNN